MRRHGFTLPELLAALAAAIVLIAIAIPVWRTHVLRTQRAEAHAALSELQLAQEHFFARRARYADGDALSAPAPDGLNLRETSLRGHYRLELTTSDDGLSYLAKARAMNSTGKDADTRCVIFSVDQNGMRRSFDASGADSTDICWR